MSACDLVIYGVIKSQITPRNVVYSHGNSHVGTMCKQGEPVEFTTRMDFLSLFSTVRTFIIAYKQMVSEQKPHS